ncbi:MAG: hypothetical protein KGL57_04355 [Burkholderiales bacterium]|nr:hypothetical protein [Burkholderiales bacterium]
MDFLRRTLVLGLPVAAISGLHGCGGANGNGASDRATAQSANQSTAQADATATGGGNFSIRNRNNGNFPLLNGSFDLVAQPSLIQALINAGASGGIGPVLALQLSTARASGADTLIAELSLSVKLDNAAPTGAASYRLGSGGAMASDALITCRQIGTDGSVKAYAYRIVAGTLVVSQFDLANGAVTFSLQDLVANAAVGFNNLAQGSIAIQTNAAATVRTALENSGSQLS